MGVLVMGNGTMTRLGFKALWFVLSSRLIYYGNAGHNGTCGCFLFLRTMNRHRFCDQISFVGVWYPVIVIVFRHPRFVDIVDAQ